MELQQVSKSRIKYLQSLKLKKYRQKYAAFVVEGRKVSHEFLKHNPQIIKAIYALPTWYRQCQELWRQLSCTSFQVSDKELARISSLKAPDQVLLECEIEQPECPPDAKWILYLDGISDPGNLGTIIRSADWFGVDLVCLSTHSVDEFNPKVVQATMGSMARIPIVRFSVLELQALYASLPWLIATLDGVPIQNLETHSTGILMVGGESHGIVSKLDEINHTKVMITGKKSHLVDSLNVAIATSILLQKLTVG